jgi:pullulanase/glycogen debranching enzyme
MIGQLQPGNPPSVQDVRSIDLALDGAVSGLWTIDAGACRLMDGHIYHYWFEVDDSRSTTQPPSRIQVSDPFAFSIDWRAFPPNAKDNSQPATVIKFIGGKLVDCDPSGDQATFKHDPTPDTLPTNIQLVIYELPTAWAMTRSLNQPERASATFVDVAALVDENIGGANFSELEVLLAGKSYLTELGINALEVLPAADSFYKREWGYDTSHYLAPDYELGYPDGNLSPTANRDLAFLVESCHRKGIRFFIDVVMAFGKEDSYNHIDHENFHIDNPSQTPNDPDAWTSIRSNGRSELRNGFGSTLWRFAKRVNTYDPLSGGTQAISPAAQLMLASLTRWMRDFHIDGIRMDSVENVANWDFISSFTSRARSLWNEQWQRLGLAGGSDARFFVVGEELSLPFSILQGGRLDGLWNEEFQSRIRAAILGENVTGEPSFEWTVRKAIDCRLLGFQDGAQAINYITKHDVEGYRHERLFNMLRGFPDNQIEKRIKLAFVCLLTAVGIPMILAGEEFADQHDFFDQDGHVTQKAGKQIDPVNFSRLTNSSPDPMDEDARYAPMRRRIFIYVQTLIRFRTHCAALAQNETEFLHVDFDAGKRVLVWRRGSALVASVIVVANFSDFYSIPGTDYQVNNWPSTPPGKKWIEITQGRTVDPVWVGREAIYPWEAKVYTLSP